MSEEHGLYVLDINYCDLSSEVHQQPLSFLTLFVASLEPMSTTTTTTTHRIHRPLPSLLPTLLSHLPHFPHPSFSPAFVAVPREGVL